MPAARKNDAAQHWNFKKYYRKWQLYYIYNATSCSKMIQHTMSCCTCFWNTPSSWYNLERCDLLPAVSQVHMNSVVPSQWQENAHHLNCSCTCRVIAPPQKRTCIQIRNSKHAPKARAALAMSHCIGAISAQECHQQGRPLHMMTCAQLWGSEHSSYARHPCANSFINCGCCTVSIQTSGCFYKYVHIAANMVGKDLRNSAGADHDLKPCVQLWNLLPSIHMYSSF